MAYSLSNIYTKDYWNWTTIVEIIVGGWVVSFVEKQCSAKINKWIKSALRPGARTGHDWVVILCR